MFDRYWQGLSDREQKVYALLSIPAWFSLELAAQLAGDFLHDSRAAAELDLSMTGFISRYERDEWRFERSFREFLLIKAAALFRKEQPDIHTFLAIYYKDCSKSGTAAKKREYEYLHLYHRLLLEPRAAAKEMLSLLDRTADQYMKPVVSSLIYMLHLPPSEEGVDPLQEFIELYIACLENLSNKNRLKDIRTRIAELEEKAEGKEEEETLLKQVYRLLILVNSNIPQRRLEKIIKKYQKKQRSRSYKEHLIGKKSVILSFIEKILYKLLPIIPSVDPSRSVIKNLLFPIYFLLFIFMLPILFPLVILIGLYKISFKVDK